MLSTPKHTSTAFTSQGSISWRAAAQTLTRWEAPSTLDAVGVVLSPTSFH